MANDDMVMMMILNDNEHEDNHDDDGDQPGTLETNQLLMLVLRTTSSWPSLQRPAPCGTSARLETLLGLLL